MDYFPHDTNALNDDKLLALRIKHGPEAVFVYWGLLEKIYADEQPLCLSECNLEATSVIHRLGVGRESVLSYVSTMLELGLFSTVENDPETIISDRAKEYIETLDKKRETARQNGKKHVKKKSKNQPKNQRRTNVGTEVGSRLEPTSGDNKTLNGIGLDKLNLYQGNAASGAGGEDPAPPDGDPCPDHIKAVWVDGGAA